MYWEWLKDQNQYLTEFRSVEFVCEITFSKYCKFWRHWWRHQFKIGSKEPKLVSHAPMVIERWKSKVKGAFRWGIRLWNYFPKILKFKPQNWLKETQFVYHVRLVVKILKSGHNLVHSKKKILTEEFLNIEKPILVVSTIDNLFCSFTHVLTLHCVTLLSFSILEFSKLATISPVTCGEGCVRRISDKWWHGGVGSENSQFCRDFLLEWPLMWCDLYETFQIYL